MPRCWHGIEQSATQLVGPIFKDEHEYRQDDSCHDLCPFEKKEEASHLMNEMHTTETLRPSSMTHFTNLTSKSLLSTLSPTFTAISLTVPAPGDATAANIFMASRV